MSKEQALLTLIAVEAKRTLANVNDPEFVRHMLEGIIWAAEGANKEEVKPCT